MKIKKGFKKSPFPKSVANKQHIFDYPCHKYIGILDPKKYFSLNRLVYSLNGLFISIRRK